MYYYYCHVFFFSTSAKLRERYRHYGKRYVIKSQEINKRRSEAQNRARQAGYGGQMDGIVWLCQIAQPQVHAEDAHATPSELIELLNAESLSTGVHQMRVANGCCRCLHRRWRIRLHRW